MASINLKRYQIGMRIFPNCKTLKKYILEIMVKNTNYLMTLNMFLKTMNRVTNFGTLITKFNFGTTKLCEVVSFSVLIVVRKELSGRGNTTSCIYTTEKSFLKKFGIYSYQNHVSLHCINCNSCNNNCIVYGITICFSEGDET